VSVQINQVPGGMMSNLADHLSPEMDKLRKDIGELALNEEDVLTFAMFPDLGREFLQQRKDGTLVPEALLPPETKSRDRLVTGVATEFRIEVHGESYEVAVTGSGDGKIAAIYVTKGDRVTPGELLIDIV